MIPPRRHPSAAIVACILAALIVTGCQDPNADTGFHPSPIAKPNQPRGPVPAVYIPPDVPQSNIVRVNKFFEEYPWLSFSGGEAGNVDGFKCALYLESPTSRNKGVFGTGTIVVEMYRLDPGPRGEDVPVLMQTWELPAEKSYFYQSKSPTHFGWGYGLRLKWDDNVDVRGRKVAILIKYVREDGRTIHSPRKVLRVPLASDVRSHPAPPGRVAPRPQPHAAPPQPRPAPQQPARRG